MAFRRRVVALVLVLAAVPGVASAHEISGRFEAPLPLSLLFGGAAATVGLTALVLAFRVEGRTRHADAEIAISAPAADTLRAAARTTFFLAFALVLATGLFGRQVQIENFATVFVWAVWLKGVALLAALVGSPWQVLSPWRTLYDALSRVEGRPLGRWDYPAWLGVAPALLGYLCWIGVAENLTAIPRSPRATAVLIAGYALAMVLGGVAFGPAWFRQADALAVLYRLFGRVAPVDARRTGAGGYQLRLRAPWQGCVASVGGLAAVAFVVATVYTVSFDGFTSTPEYQTVLFAVQDILGPGSLAGLALYVGGFLGFLAAFLATTGLVRVAAGNREGDWRRTATAFAPTVLPIAVAYEVAHNYPFVLENAGLVPATLYSFAGLGHGPTVGLLGWLSVGAFWWSQVLLVVLGHVVAVVAAHYVALARYETVARARRGHVPLVVLMIGYTVLSLWIVSRPVVG